MKETNFSLPITLALIVAICGAIALIVLYSEPFQKESVNTSTGTDDQTEETIEIDYTDLIEIKEENVEASIDVSYPANAPEEVQEYMNEQLAEFRTQSTQEKFVDVPYIFSGTVEVYPTDQFTSFVVITYEYTGGANGNGYVQSFVYKDGERIDVSEAVDLDARTDDILEKIYIHLNDLRGFEIEEEEKQDLASALEDRGVLTDFYVTDQTFGFIFSEYEISYGAVGIIDVQITREPTGGDD